MLSGAKGIAQVLNLLEIMAKTMPKPWNLPSGGSATHPEVQKQVVQHPARHVVVFWRLAVPYRGQHVLGVRADVMPASQMACHVLHRPHAPLSPPQLFDSHPLGTSTAKPQRLSREQGLSIPMVGALLAGCHALVAVTLCVFAFSTAVVDGPLLLATYLRTRLCSLARPAQP